MPKGIVRFQDRNGKGWYARLQRKGNILINDKTYDNHRTIRDSLSQAQDKYIAAIENMPTLDSSFARPRINKTLSTAMEGVCVGFQSYTKPGHQTPSHSVRIFVNYRPGPVGTKNKVKAFFCGTNNTLDKARFEKILLLAYAHRCYFNDLCLLGQESKLSKGFPSKQYLLRRVKQAEFKPVNYEKLVNIFFSTLK